MDISMPPRAYLAYSSSDKAYVEEVVSRLSRAHVIYDKQSFEPGEDFRQLIREGLEKASLLVLFASPDSLKSAWVNFELDEYEMKRVRDPAARVLVIGLDSSINSRDLPEWMRRFLALLGGVAPVRAARFIQRRLAEQIAFPYEPPFVGREKDIEEFGRQLFPAANGRPASTVVVSGLPGIGRRTFAARVLRDYLSLRMGPVLTVRGHDTLDSIYLRLVDESGELQTRSDLTRYRDTFRDALPEDRVKEFVRILGVLTKANEAAVLIDDWGRLLDDNGRYVDEIESVMEVLRNRRTEYLVLIQRRRPSFTSLQLSGASGHQLKALSLESSRVLISQHMNLSGVVANQSQVEKLAELIGGYPPLAVVATKLAQTYGLSALLADEAILVDLKLQTFIPILDRLPLNKQHWRILRLLASEFGLPLDAICVALDEAEEPTAGLIRDLVDYNLVGPTGDEYELSPPLTEAVLRMKGRFKQSEFAAIATKLRKRYWRGDQVPALSVLEALVHATGRGGGSLDAEFRDVILPSSLVRLAEDAYHAQDWEQAVTFSRLALKADPELHDAREYLIKSYVRLEKWGDAETELGEVERRRLRRQFYLKGFIAWKRGELEKAVNALRSAVRVGDRSISVTRDLAHCLFRLGTKKSLDEARSLMQAALGRPNPNRFIVDLAAQIAIERQAWREVEELLGLLQGVDSPQSFRYRRAAYLAARGRPFEALNDAEYACSGKSARFEMRVLLASVLIDCRKFEEADEAIAKLRARTEWHKDIQIGLRCELLIRQAKWREAETVWQGLRSKDRPVHLGLRREILKIKVNDESLPLVEREEVKEELSGLDEQLPVRIEADRDDD